MNERCHRCEFDMRRQAWTQQDKQAHTATSAPTDRLSNAADLARLMNCRVREIRNLRYAVLPTIKLRLLIRFEPDAVETCLRQPRS